MGSPPTTIVLREGKVKRAGKTHSQLRLAQIPKHEDQRSNPNYRYCHTNVIRLPNLWSRNITKKQGHRTRTPLQWGLRKDRDPPKRNYWLQRLSKKHSGEFHKCSIQIKGQMRLPATTYTSPKSQSKKCWSHNRTIWMFPHHHPLRSWLQKH